MEEVQCTRDSVLLFRSPKDGAEDPYDKALTEHGFKPFSIPVLEFNFINIDKLATLLSDHKNHSAIVFTSQRAVEASVLALEKVTEQEASDGKKNICAELPCFVVGDSTRNAALDAGFSPNDGESGNAENLAKKIINELNHGDKPLLYPCGNLRKDTLSVKLKQAGFILNEIEVYETIRNKNISTRVQDYIDQEGMPEVVVYFSPSGVQYTDDIVKTGLLPLQSVIKIVAIGPTTEKELIKQGLPVFGVAAQPDPGGIVEVLLKDRKS